MAVTLSNLVFSVAGNKRRTIGTVTLDSSYVTGGEPISANAVGLSSIERFNVENPINSTPAMRGATYDHTNNKLIVFDDAFAEIANGTNLSAFSAKFEATGY